MQDINSVLRRDELRKRITYIFKRREQGAHLTHDEEYIYRALTGFHDTTAIEQAIEDFLYVVDLLGLFDTPVQIESWRVPIRGKRW